VIRQTLTQSALIGLALALVAGAANAADPEEISIEAFNAQGEFVRHKNVPCLVSPILTPLDSQEAHFKKVPGLADATGVSFEAASKPGFYLRNRGGRIILAKCPEPNDKRDATFKVAPGLADEQNGWLSLELLNKSPGQYLENRKGELWAGTKQDGAEYQKSATFRLVKPVVNPKPPLSGKAGPNTKAFDAVMLKYMEKINCTAAELAIARNGALIESRGYGWSDQRGKVPMQPNNPMAIGSCEKPIEAAAVRQLAHAGKFKLNDSILKTLKTKPQGEVVDKRIWDITIQHVLDHKTGWEGEPLKRAMQAAAAKGLKDNSTEELLGFLMAQKLADAPGAKAAFSNFGYDALRLLIAKTTGQTFAQYVRRQMFKPFGVRELSDVQDPGLEIKGEPPQVWNASGIMYDGAPKPPAAPLRASAPALCAFMHRFWISGEPRTSAAFEFAYDGLADNTTTVVFQGKDKIDFACIFNGHAKVSQDEIRKELQALIEKK
jgi:CubicO group peptidase (beta-lactamase class C family)